MATDEDPGGPNTPRNIHKSEMIFERRDDDLVGAPISAGDGEKTGGVAGLECDLDQVVSTRGPMPVAKAVDYLIQAARAIEAMHAQGTVHRDIKPSNLFLDSTGSVRVLNPGVDRIVDANNAAAGLTQHGIDMATVDFIAPEHADDSHRVDRRADIYSLGCTLYFLLTGSAPFLGETVSRKLTAHREQDAPSLRALRPEVSMALEACFQKMMAKRPDDRPGSMTEVIALLQASQPLFVRREEHEGLLVNRDFSLEDLLMDVRPKAAPAPIRPAKTVARPLKRTAITASRARPWHAAAALFALTAAGLLVAAFVRFVGARGWPAVTEIESPPSLTYPDMNQHKPTAKLAPSAQAKPEPKTIFDGKSGQGWMLCNRGPIPPQNIQSDGLNPHRSGSYLVVYNQKLGDFVLDFDFKLTKGCNSGVFLRVSDLNDPVQTGIEVALDDTRRGDDRDSGAFHGLVPPTVYAQKPAGQWNHMTITAQGPRLAVTLNETEVSSINLDLWALPGKRPDGADHRFADRAVAASARTGYLGFQDLAGDCWFKNIVLNSKAGETTPNSPALVGGGSTSAPGK